MSRDLSDLRQEYISRGLQEEQIAADPFTQFETWFNEVENLRIDLANAMVLATADSDGVPSARFVLLKEFSEQGFTFYSSQLSQKGRELESRPQASLVFYWKELHRQVRIQGKVEKLPVDAVDEYFAGRPRGSQISAWVASQSEEIPDRDYMTARVKELVDAFSGKPVPRPESWLGYRLIPVTLEFWQGQENRLHDRIVYKPGEAGSWKVSRLAP